MDLALAAAVGFYAAWAACVHQAPLVVWAPAAAVAGWLLLAVCGSYAGLWGPCCPAGCLSCSAAMAAVVGLVECATGALLFLFPAVLRDWLGRLDALAPGAVPGWVREVDRREPARLAVATLLLGLGSAELLLRLAASQGLAAGATARRVQAGAPLTRPAGPRWGGGGGRRGPAPDRLRGILGRPLGGGGGGGGEPLLGTTARADDFAGKYYDRSERRWAPIASLHSDPEAAIQAPVVSARGRMRGATARDPGSWM